MPIRALCSVALEEMPSEPWRQNPTSGGDVGAPRRTRCVDGDSLASVAYAEYGDPTAVAGRSPAYNGIDDPLRLPARHASSCCPSPEDWL